MKNDKFDLNLLRDWVSLDNKALRLSEITISGRFHSRNFNFTVLKSCWKNVKDFFLYALDPDRLHYKIEDGEDWGGFETYKITVAEDLREGLVKTIAISEGLLFDRERELNKYLAWYFEGANYGAQIKSLLSEIRFLKLEIQKFYFFINE